jgi:hypothetical protein
MSKQRFGQTVNLPAYAFGGSNPPRPTRAQRHDAASVVIDAHVLIARHRVQGPAQSVGTLEEQTCCRGAVVDELSVVGGRFADPSSEMSVVATAPRSEPKAREVATMISRGFIVSPVVEPSPPPYGEREW